MTDRQTFVRELSRLTFERATPEVRRHFLALFADPAIDWQDLAQPVASLLLRDQDEELLDAYLRRCVNPSWELEQRLVRMRDEGRRLPALAAQAFLNGYLWPDTNEPIDDPLIRAMYRPPDADAQFEDAGLQRMLIDEPAEEARLAATLHDEVPFDAVSAAVRAQYEQHPFPRWLSLHRPEPDRDPASRRALVAGCGTGREAIALALRHPAWQIEAIDISRRSLGYAMRKARELGADNVTFRLADLRRVEGTYDVIQAFGVLHHLADPLEGLRALRNLLARDGEMRIGVYSRRARASLQRLRDLGGDAEPRVARARIIAALDDDERASLESIEFFERGYFIDTLYHAHEVALTPLELQAMLDAAGLIADADLAEWEAREREDPSLFLKMIRCRVTIAP